jgi:hypothetical protein
LKASARRRYAGHVILAVSADNRYRVGKLGPGTKLGGKRDPVPGATALKIGADV